MIVVNPTAGRGRPMQAATAVAAALASAGWQTDTLPTLRAGHATELARQCGDDVGLLVVVGGDGTLREAVAGLGGRPLPVGLVPLGNANVMARELGIPRAVPQAAAVLAGGRASTIDAGCVNGVVFLAMVGVGFDGRVTAGVGRLRATTSGAWLYRTSAAIAYGLAALPPLLDPRGARLQVDVDGVSLGEAFASVVVSNAETYALGWAVTPGADVRDGRLDHQVSRRRAPWFVLLGHAAAVAHRRVPAALAGYGAGRSYRIAGDRDCRWQMDGDPMPPVRELHIDILPAHVRMIVPA